MCFDIWFFRRFYAAVERAAYVDSLVIHQAQCPAYNLSGFTKNAPAFKKSLGVLVQKIQKMTDDTVILAESLYTATVEVDGMKEDVTCLKKLLQECKNFLLQIRGDSGIFIDSVMKCLEYGDLTKESKDEMKIAVACGNFEGLNSYMTELFRLFDCSELTYEKFATVCVAADPICQKGMQTCEEKRKAAKSNKNQARVVGGFGAVVAAGGAGVCIAVAVLSGGIAIPAIVGGGACATAAITGAVGYNMAMKYGKAADVFKKISNGFVSIKESISEVDMAVHQIQQVLRAVYLDMKNVHDLDQSVDYDYDSFNRLFDTLLHSIEDAKKKVDKTRIRKLKIE